MIKKGVQMLCDVAIVSGSNYPIILSVRKSFDLDPGEHHIVVIDVPKLI